VLNGERTIPYPVTSFIKCAQIQHPVFLFTLYRSLNGGGFGPFFFIWALYQKIFKNFWKLG